MSDKLIIGPGRLSFPALFTPQTDDSGNTKYGLTLLLPPDFDTKPLEKALHDAAVEKWGPDKAKWPKKMNFIKEVIRDADEKSNLGGYETGWKFISMRSKNAPGIVDAVRQKVQDEREVYAGRWARVTARAFAYENKTKGVGFGLQNVQLLKHDKPFGGAGPAENDFDDFAEELGGADGNWNE